MDASVAYLQSRPTVTVSFGMPIVESAITIDAAAADLFALTQDYYLRKDWDPFVADIRFLDGHTVAAPGVRVWVRSWQGLEMTTEYVTVDPPGTVAIKMTDGPRFFEAFGGSWRFMAISATQTRVHFRYNFRTRWRSLRPLVDPLVRAVFGRDIRARLRGLKQAAEHTDILERLGSKPSADG